MEGFFRLQEMIVSLMRSGKFLRVLDLCEQNIKFADRFHSTILKLIRGCCRKSALPDVLRLDPP